VLRVADALDRTHRNVVRTIGTREYERECRIDIAVAGQADSELFIARKKSDLLASVMMKPIVFRIVPRNSKPEREGDDGPTP
jgi:hypothetical protein